MKLNETIPEVADFPPLKPVLSFVYPEPVEGSKGRNEKISLLDNLPETSLTFFITKVFCNIFAL